MRILYIDHHASVPGLGGDTRAYELAQQWKKAGDEVTVLAAGYSHRRAANPELTEEMTEKKYGEVRVCFLAVPGYERGVGGVGRSISAFLKKLHRMAPVLAGRYRPEVIICASGYPYDFFYAGRLARLCGARTVFELRELWPLTQRELYPQEAKGKWVLADRALAYALKNAGLVASLLHGGEFYCGQRGINPHGYCLLNATAAPLPEPQTLRREDAEAFAALQKKYPFIVAFGGGLSHRRRPELLASVLPGLAGEGIGGVFCGNGGYKLLLGRMAREKELENILLLDAQTEGRRQTILNAADAIYYSDDRRASGRYGAYCPLLLRLMHTGKPLALAVCGERNPAQLCGCGLTGESPVELKRVLRELCALTPEERDSMGERGREAAERHHSPKMTAEAYRRALLRLLA